MMLLQLVPGPECEKHCFKETPERFETEHVAFSGETFKSPFVPGVSAVFHPLVPQCGFE